MMRAGACSREPDGALGALGGARAARSRGVSPLLTVPSETVRFRAGVRKWEGEQGHVLVVKLGMLVGPVGALGVGFVGQTPAFAGASGGRCASTSRVQAMVVGAMQSAGTLMAEYWRGDRVTSCARGARAPGEGPCALAEGRPVHLRGRDDR